jgi:casein kinase 1
MTETSQSISINVNNNKYVLEQKIGSGSFGSVYLAKDNFNKVYAIKLESIDIDVPQLHIEKQIYKILNDHKGFPKVYNYLVNYKLPWGKFNILIMDCLDLSLDDLFEKCDKKFSLKTVIQLAIQMIQRIEVLHSCSIMHRDLKPDNFVIGSNNLLHLIDFGLSKLFRDIITHIHIPYRENKRMIGTPRYSSLNTHLGIEQSRRDDLESIGYILIYFLKGSLPWQGLKAENRKLKYQKIMDKKLGTSKHVLCKGLPQQFLVYFHYVQHLRFQDKPDYQYLIKLFQDLAKEFNIILDTVYDWDNIITTEQNNEETKQDIDISSVQVEQYININQDLPSSLHLTKHPNSFV